jgi:membrane protease YdiL (CAAX protease family)
MAAGRPAVRALAIGAYILAVESLRVLFVHVPYAAVPALILGGAALTFTAVAFPLERLGLSRRRLGLRILGGLALGAVLVLPAAVRSGAPLLPAGLALAAVAVSIGQEVAFRGALYAALEDLGGAPLAILGSTMLWTVAHALSHPPAFLGAVAAAGLLLALWRWACKDLVGPIIAHVIADVGL